MADRFVFRYQLTAAHLRPAARWMIWHRYGRNIAVRVLIVLVIGVLTLNVWLDEGFTFLFTIFAAIGLAQILSLILIYPRLMKILTKSNMIGMDQVVTLDGESFELQGPGVLSRLDWSLMWQVVAREDGLIVQPSQNAYWWLPYKSLEGGFDRAKLGAFLASLPVQVRR